MGITDSSFESLDCVSSIISIIMIVIGVIGFVITLFLLVKNIGGKKYKNLKSLFFGLVTCGMCICIPSLFATMSDLSFSMSYGISSSSDFSWLSYGIGLLLIASVFGYIQSGIRDNSNNEEEESEE